MTADRMPGKDDVLFAREGSGYFRTRSIGAERIKYLLSNRHNKLNRRAAGRPMNATLAAVHVPGKYMGGISICMKEG